MPRCDKELGNLVSDCSVPGPEHERHGFCCNILIHFGGRSSLGLESQTDAAVGDDAALDEVCGCFELSIFYLNWFISCP